MSDRVQFTVTTAHGPGLDHAVKVVRMEPRLDEDIVPDHCLSMGGGTARH